MAIVKFEKNRAHQRYRTKSGVPVPGVTTVLGILKNEALMVWAWQCGIDGQDFRKVRDQAASIGTLAHFMAECHVRGDQPDLSEFSKADIGLAENSFLKFLEFWEGEGMVLNHSERQLVSEEHLFGGTLDLDCTDRQGRRCLVDLKTSKGIYPVEYYSQVAAYSRLHSEAGDPPFQKHIIARIGKKEAGDFEVRVLPDLDKYWELFMACLATHKALRVLKD